MALFDDTSRTGFELELLAPKGKTRKELADRLARTWGGSVRYGLKFLGAFDQRGADEPLCKLNLAFRVEKDGKQLVDIVDDCTIESELDREAKPIRGSFLLVTNDVRLGHWAEQVAWVDRLDVRAMLQPFFDTFFGDLGEPGEGGVRRDQRAVFDRLGNTLAVLSPPERDRERVAEIVTRPLLAAEREEFLADILDAARELEFFIPSEGALHVHYDAGPWRDTRRLAQLIDAFAAQRHRLRHAVQTNPACKRLGSYGDDVVGAAMEELSRIANGNRATPFPEFAARILEAGTNKFVDLNIQGVVKKRPKQPTLEARFFPMAMEIDRIMDMLGTVEDFLLTAYGRD